MIDVWPALFSPGLNNIDFDDLKNACLQGQLATPRRVELFENLSRFFLHLSNLGICGAIWIVGSFTTCKPEPSDIDIVLFLEQNSTERLNDDDMGELQALLDIYSSRERYLLDLNVDILGREIPAGWQNLMGFYKDGTTPRGVAILQLEGNVKTLQSSS